MKITLQPLTQKGKIMSNGNGKVQILAEEGDTVVVCGSVRVRFNASGGIDVYGDVPVALHPAANDAMKLKAALQIGDLIITANTDAMKLKAALQIGDLDDGGIYVGPSAEDGRPLHTALADESEYLTLDEAYAVAEKMREQPGRELAHIPTPRELDKNLFNNRNKGHLKGTFITSSSKPLSNSAYRSYVPYYCGPDAVVQRFDDRGQTYNYSKGRYCRFPVRLVW